MRKIFNRKLVSSTVLILFVVLFPIYNFIEQSYTVQSATVEEGVKAVGEITNQVIQQEINIHAPIRQYEIQFATYMRENTGRIQVTITQGDNSIKSIIDTTTLKDNEYAQINMDYSGLEVGKAIVTIESIGSTQGNAVTIYQTNDKSMGVLSINGEVVDGGIAQRITYYDTDTIRTTLMLSIVLLVGVLYIVYHLNYKGDKEQSWTLYGVVSIVIFTQLCIIYPGLTWEGQPYAEAATNFYYYAKNQSFIDNLFLPDAGYLPMGQRLITLLGVKIFNIDKYIFVYMQIIATVSISCISAMFCLEFYKNYGTRLFRVIVSIVLGVGILHVNETHVFINFMYYGIVFIILMLLLDLNKLSKIFYVGITIFTAIICISKSYYVVLVPTILIIFILFFKKLTRRLKIYLSVIVFSSSIQLVYAVQNIHIFTGDTRGVRINIFELLEKVYYYFCQLVIWMLYGPHSIIVNPILMYIGITITLIGILYLLYKYIKYIGIDKEIIVFGMSMLIIGGVFALNILTLDYYKQEISWMTGGGIVPVRHIFFACIGLLIGMLLLVKIVRGLLLECHHYDAITLNRTFKYIYIFIGICMIIRFNIISTQPIIKEYQSDWQEYYSLFEEDSYSIPIEPRYDWKISEGSKEVTIGYADIGATKIIDNQTRTVHELEINDLEELQGKEIIAIYLNNNLASRFQKIVMVAYNEIGEVVQQIPQVNDIGRVSVGFIPQEELKGVSKIKFFTKDGDEAYVSPHINIIVE